MAFTVQSLLEDYQSSKPDIRAEKITFTGVGEKDVYNITAPFEDEGELVIAGRVEGRDTEHSDVVFFVEEDGVWKPRKDTKTYALQDPFFTRIDGELVFGGVEIFPHPTHEGALSWRTVFYRGSTINELERFATGPNGMKDIRLIELANGKIGVFTRPQGEKGGRGKIGYTEIASLEELTPEVIDKAPLIDSHFIDEEWGGANEVHLLKNGKIGVLGHIAKFDENGDRHYYPMVFTYDPDTSEISDMEIIATRADFPDGPAKRDDLQDVLFSGGLVCLEDGQAELYVGVSDAEAHKAILPDPFIKYEKESIRKGKER
ncbi:MTP-1 family protein [Pseudalkalibacillus sp. R45]|uniref:MTP-1 family protein n=1 Tax=Pseudalkalibacillus sp. R45 TaxID=3457433 RepID=UPI003FCCAFBB